MIKSENVKVGSKVVICLDGEDFEGMVVDEFDGLVYVELDHNGKQHRMSEVKRILSEPEDDDRPNPAPEKDYAPRGQMKKTEAAPQQRRNKKKAAPEKPLSLVNAAHKVLKEEGREMSCPEMVEVAVKKGYWKPGLGKTPSQTLYAAILRELKMSNERFKRSDVGGKFHAVP